MIILKAKAWVGLGYTTRTNLGMAFQAKDPEPDQVDPEASDRSDQQMVVSHIRRSKETIKGFPQDQHRGEDEQG